MSGLRRAADVAGGLLGLGVLGLVAAQLLATAVGRPMIHDEHQFVAPGALLSQRGLLPFVDYPYFHMPYLPLLYGGVFVFTDQLLLGARLVSAGFAIALAALLVQQAWRVFDCCAPLLRAALAAAALFLLVDNPLFRQADGLTWNHDGGLLFSTAGLLCLCRARSGSHARRDALLGGLCLAAATGIRLSFAPLAIPFGLLMLLPLRARSTREGGDELPHAGEPGDAPAASAPAATGVRPAPGPWGRVGWLLLGGVLGSLPALALFAAAPDAFLFGNLGYPLLNTEWYAKMGVETAMTPASKLAWLFTEALAEPATLVLLLLALVGLLARDVLRDGFAGGRTLPAAAALLCLPFAFAGAMAPSPGWPQYYAACIPFLLLIALHGLGGLMRAGGAPALACGLLLTGGAVAAGFGWSERGDPRLLASPERWETSAVHRVGEQIAQRVGDGLVLTEAPIFVLEGGARIYPFNATGPFAFRTGHLLSDERRAELGIKIHKDLPQILKQTPPDAILTGSDGWLAVPTRQFAQVKQLVPFELQNGFMLLFKP